MPRHGGAPFGAPPECALPRRKLGRARAGSTAQLALYPIVAWNGGMRPCLCMCRHPELRSTGHRRPRGDSSRRLARAHRHLRVWRLGGERLRHVEAYTWTDPGGIGGSPSMHRRRRRRCNWHGPAIHTCNRHGPSIHTDLGCGDRRGSSRGGLRRRWRAVARWTHARRCSTMRWCGWRCWRQRC